MVTIAAEFLAAPVSQAAIPAIDSIPQFDLQSGSGLKPVANLDTFGTRDWLNKHESAGHRRLQIITTGVYLTTPRMDMLAKNRYILSRAREVEVFIENTLDNAFKLSGFCDVLFVANSPYNQVPSLLKNVIRGKDGEEVYEYLKALA